VLRQRSTGGTIIRAIILIEAHTCTFYAEESSAHLFFRKKRSIGNASSGKAVNERDVSLNGARCICAAARRISLVEQYLGSRNFSTSVRLTASFCVRDFIHSSAADDATTL
jgi:hypothetical protein